MFERSIFHPSGAGEKAIGYVSITFKECSAGTVNLGVVSI